MMNTDSGWALRLTTAVCMAAVLSGCATQSRSHDDLRLPPDEPPAIRNTTDRPLTLDAMLQQDDFDLPRALLMFSEQYYPEFSGKTSHDIGIESRLQRLDGYTRDLQRLLQRERTPRGRLHVLIEFVHVTLGLRFDATDPQGHNPENLFLDRVLQNRRGYCVTLSLAYIIFGQAAGLDVAGIRVPGHFVVRYRDNEPDGHPYETLIETTNFGETLEDTYYWSKYRFSSTAVTAGTYLTALTDKQIFGTIFNNLAGLTHLRGDHETAIERYNRAIELAPNQCEAMYNRALVYRKLARDKDALKDFNLAIRIDPNFVHAYLARARLLYDSGEKTQAREDLGEAMRRRADWPEPHMLDGIFLAKDGELDRAKAAFLKVLELDPGFNSARLGIAEIERAQGREAEARKWETEAGRR